MKEIKFRAWDKEKNQMIPDFDNWIDFYGNYWRAPDKVHDTPNQEIYTPVNQPILMQYTGLKDKNGKEIYESDSDGRRVVKYVSDYGGFCLWDGDRYTPLTCDVAMFFEVKGNEYEN